jgi:hypothetical protein
LGGVAYVEENKDSKFNHTINVKIMDYDIAEDGGQELTTDENGEKFVLTVCELHGYSDCVKNVKIVVSGGVIQDLISDDGVNVVVRDYDNDVQATEIL